MRRPLPAVAACLALSGVLSGCSTLGLRGVQDLPLPGGASLGSHPYTVTAEFANVLNLVPQAAVEVNDVAVGRVESITLPHGTWTAHVRMLVNGDVRLPANAYAQIEQSSLLGEKYVALSTPTTPTGRLADHATIPVGRTDRNVQVEDVLGALSLLLNGGGIAQIQTITAELNRTLSGNEPQVRALLTQVRTLTADLNAHRAGITAALDGVNRLAATLDGHRTEIAGVLDQLTPGLKVIDRQRTQLVGMLQALTRLSGVAVDTVHRSQADLVADLKALAPTLQKLADSGKDLPDSLQALFTFPFTDAVLPAIKGDYLNVYLSVRAQPGTRLIPSMPLPSTAGGGN